MALASGKDIRFSNCPICECDDFVPFITRMDLLLWENNDQDQYQMVKCSKCDTVYLNPRPLTYDALAKFYPTEYDQYTISPYEEANPLRRIFRLYGLKKRFLSIKKYMPNGGKLLDVGAATGDFAEFTVKQGNWEVDIVEINAEAQKALKLRCPDINVVGATLEDLDKNQGVYDAITLWNVFEHLLFPLENMQTIKQLLKPNGIVVINTPIIDSFDHQMFKEYWVGYELPRHIFLMRQLGIQNFFERLGLKIIDVSCTYGSHAAFMTSLGFLLRGKFHAQKKHIEFFNQFAYSIPARVAFSPYFSLIDAIKKSTSVTIIAKG